MEGYGHNFVRFCFVSAKITGQYLSGRISHTILGKHRKWQRVHTSTNIFNGICFNVRCYLKDLNLCSHLTMIIAQGWGLFSNMMTSSNGNIFRGTGHLCGEFTGPRWIPRTKASDTELRCLICAWINVWVNNRDAGDLRRHRCHYDVIVMNLDMNVWEQVQLSVRIHLWRFWNSGLPLSCQAE